MIGDKWWWWPPATGSVVGHRRLETLVGDGGWIGDRGQTFS